jgi:hypothetical protein
LFSHLRTSKRGCPKNKRTRAPLFYDMNFKRRERALCPSKRAWQHLNGNGKKLKGDFGRAYKKAEAARRTPEGGCL